MGGHPTYKCSPQERLFPASSFCHKHPTLLAQMAEERLQTLEDDNAAMRKLLEFNGLLLRMIHSWILCTYTLADSTAQVSMNQHWEGCLPSAA